ncbi:MAG: FAD-dependent oxidoreductase [Spirochaetaceae bacterium]|nr:MAG: FAD-dependent oxidoreductase [Spirochaetaceae bacterium]
MHEQTEILIVGASASGTCAAIQAGRMGRRVVVYESSPWVGGMLTAAGVSAIDGNNMLPSGLWGEFREALRAHYGGADRLEVGWVSNTLFDPRVGQKILRSWIDALPTVELRLGWRCTGVTRTGNRITGARFARADGSQERTVCAQITIFADEYGDAVVAAGLPWRVGLEARDETGEPQAPDVALPHPQDFTWCATIGAPPSGFADASPGPVFAPGDEYERILGDPPITWNRLLDYGRLPDDLLMLNWPTQDCYGDYLDPATREQVTAAGREKTKRLVRALVDAYGPDAIGLPTVYPTGTCALIPYIREARRIRAIATMTTADLTAPNESTARLTSVAVGDYPLDHHRANDPQAPRIEFPPISAFCVPYGVMVPQDAGGALVTEKSIGVTGLVNGCTRLQPVVMQLGQAAGAAAALCIDLNTEPESLRIESLQAELLDSRAYLVPAMDAPATHPAYRALHWCGVRGILGLRFRSEGWANRAWIDPDSPLTAEAAARALESLSGDALPGATRTVLRIAHDAERQIAAGRPPTRHEFASRIYGAVVEGSRTTSSG